MVTKEKSFAMFLGGKRRGPSMARLDNVEKRWSVMFLGHEKGVPQWHTVSHTDMAMVGSLNF
jgi:hypothetical protein